MLDKAHDKSIKNALRVAEKHRHRLILHVAEEKSDALTMVRDLLLAVKIDDVLWVDACLSDPLKQLRARLGSEINTVVINAYDGLNPNVLGIISGLVKAGGIFVLITPPVEKWPDYQDPDYQRMQSEGDEQKRQSGRFIRHLRRVLQAHHDDIIQINASGWVANKNTGNVPSPVDLTEQAQLIGKIQKVMTGRAKRPLVIEADRGRGKSAALGIAAARLLQSSARAIHIGICSISHEAVRCLFTHAADTLNQEQEKGLSLAYKESVMTYFSADQLLHEKPDLDLLIVDEAAALPVSLLQGFLELYTRLIFSTTVHGYEGNGRGFAIRFKKSLTEKMPGCRHCTLKQPIRFADNDPLEKLINDMLLLDADADADADAVQVPAVVAEPCFQWISQDELYSDLDKLKQVFGLLVSAHYQTSPDDLRLMLDHPHVKIAAAIFNDQIIAVALMMEEGDFSEGQKQQLFMGNRRFRGHLVPQMLKTGGIQEALDYKFQRVMRIAVLPVWQRQGLGSRLLTFIRQKLLSDAVDFLSVSFSCETDVFSFWQKNGYRLMRLGSHKSASTGLYSACLLDPLNDEASIKANSWFAFNAASIGYQLLTQNRDAPAALVELIVKGMRFEYHALDKQCMIDYSAGKMAFESVQPSLYRLYRYAVSSGQTFAEDERTRYIIIDKLLLNHLWCDIVERYHLTGRKQVEQIIRDSLRQLSLSIF